MSVSKQIIEVTARTLEEAKKLAAKQLGVTLNELSVNVIEEKKRLFGLNQVRITAEAQKPKQESVRSQSRPIFSKKESSERSRNVESEPSPSKDVVGASVKQKEALKDQDSKGEESIQQDPGEGVVATEKDAEEILHVASKILSLAGLNVEAEISGLNGRYVNLSLSGKDVSYLIGRRGETLNSFQYLLNVLVSRKLLNGVRVTLDGDNYRSKREESLKKLAVKIAEEVKERGEEAVLDALPAFERRVIHNVLQGYEGITTYSEGQDPDRNVVIAPS